MANPTSLMPKNVAIPQFHFILPKECQKCKQKLSDGKNNNFLIFPGGIFVCAPCLVKSESVLHYPVVGKGKECNSEDKKLAYVFPDKKTLCHESNKEVTVLMPEIKKCKVCANSNNKELIIVSPIIEVLCLDCSGKAKLEESFKYPETENLDFWKCIFCKEKLSVEYILALNESLTIHKICRECMLNKGLGLRENSTKYNDMIPSVMEEFFGNMDQVENGELSIQSAIGSSVDTVKSLVGGNKHVDEMLDVFSNPGNHKDLPLTSTNKKEIKDTINNFKHILGPMFGNNGPPELGNMFEKMLDQVNMSLDDGNDSQNLGSFVESLMGKFGSNVAAIKKKEKDVDDNKEEKISDNEKDEDEDDSGDDSEEEWY